MFSQQTCYVIKQNIVFLFFCKMIHVHSFSRMHPFHFDSYLTAYFSCKAFNLFVNAFTNHKQLSLHPISSYTHLFKPVQCSNLLVWSEENKHRTYVIKEGLRITKSMSKKCSSPVSVHVLIQTGGYLFEMIEVIAFHQSLSCNAYGVIYG